MKKYILTAVLTSLIFVSCSTGTTAEETAPAVDTCTAKVDTAKCCDTTAVVKVDTLAKTK